MSSDRCIKCNKKLKNPISIKREMGEVCYQKELEAKEKENEEDYE